MKIFWRVIRNTFMAFNMWLGMIFVSGYLVPILHGDSPENLLDMLTTPAAYFFMAVAVAISIFFIATDTAKIVSDVFDFVQNTQLRRILTASWFLLCPLITFIVIVLGFIALAWTLDAVASIFR